MTSQAASPTVVADPRVRVAKKIVTGLAAVVGLILACTFGLAVYHWTTDRPAREMFYPPATKLPGQ